MNRNFAKVIYTQTYKDQRKSMDMSEVDKLEQAIDVHGYRGISKMKHNGVVNIKPTDKELLKSLVKFKTLENNLLNNITEKHYADVKAVAHVPNGNRSIGCIYVNDKDELILYVLGFSNYNHQIF